jgi:hypothetical protein
METPSGQAPSVGAPGAAVSRPARPSHLRALPAGPAADDGDAPAAGALLAMWRGWRNGGRLPALAKVEGRMAQLCPGGVLLAVARDRVEVAQRLPGAAPDLDLAALDWMRGVARAAARAGMARHELDDEAGLGLVALPFALEVEAGPGSDIASAVLCRVYALEPVEALGGAGGGFFSGMLRRLAGT